MSFRRTSVSNPCRVLCLAVLFCLLFVGRAHEAGAAAPAPVRGQAYGLVLSSHPLADAVGMRVLEAGGNAVDAAVAVGYALAVVHPAAGNIGGGGFAVLRLADGTVASLDFREKAPLAASRDMYLDSGGEVMPEASILGHKAAGVPGTVAGLSALRDRYGSLPLKQLIRPAVTLAAKGYAVSARQERSFAEFAPNLARFEASRRYFLKPDGSPYAEGDTLVQADLAATLKSIAADGSDAFYKGRVAKLIVADMEKHGGLITLADLAAYAPVWREPVRGLYRGHEIISMGPPSSGGAHIIQMLNVLEKEDIGTLGPASSASVHFMAEVMRRAYADRSACMGDPDFVSVPLERLLSAEYADATYAAIAAARGRAVPSAEVRPGPGLEEGEHTTHYSIIDGRGNAVAVTTTLNESYGCAAAVAGAGFLLNNEMDDFSAKPGVPNMYGLTGSAANAIAPQKRPLSCMSPTLVTKDGRLFMVLGSPGGARIITTVLQVISNVIDHGMNISEAVMAPRFHMQWLPDELRVERFGLARDVEARLREMGYAIEVKKPMGDVNAILVDPESGKVTGSRDPRAEF